MSGAWMSPDGMRRHGGYALLGLLFLGILTLWMPRGWPQAAIAFGLCPIGVMCMLASGGRMTPLLAIPLGAALWGLLQIVAGSTVDRWLTEVKVLDWTVAAIVCILAPWCFGGMDGARRFRRALVVFGTLVAVQATLQRYTPGGRIFWLFDAGFTTGQMGPFVYENQYAAFLELIIPMALWEAVRDGARRWRWLLAAALMAGSAVAAASVAGVGLIVLELVLVPLLAVRRGAIEEEYKPDDQTP